MMEARPLPVAYWIVYFGLKLYFFIWLRLHLMDSETSNIMRVLYQIDILMHHLWTKSQSSWGESLNIAFVLWPTFCVLFCLHQFVCNPSCIAFLFARCAPRCGGRIPKTWLSKTFRKWREGESTQLFYKMLARPIWNVFLSLRSIFLHIFLKKKKASCLNICCRSLQEITHCWLLNSAAVWLTFFISLFLTQPFRNCKFALFFCCCLSLIPLLGCPV